MAAIPWIAHLSQLSRGAFTTPPTILLAPYSGLLARCLLLLFTLIEIGADRGDVCLSADRGNAQIVKQGRPLFSGMTPERKSTRFDSFQLCVECGLRLDSIYHFLGWLLWLYRLLTLLRMHILHLYQIAVVIFYERILVVESEAELISKVTQGALECIGDCLFTGLRVLLRRIFEWNTFTLTREGEGTTKHVQLYIGCIEGRIS